MPVADTFVKPCVVAGPLRARRPATPSSSPASFVKPVVTGQDVTECYTNLPTNRPHQRGIPISEVVHTRWAGEKSVPASAWGTSERGRAPCAAAGVDFAVLRARGVRRGPIWRAGARRTPGALGGSFDARRPQQAPASAREPPTHHRVQGRRCAKADRRASPECVSRSLAPCSTRPPLQASAYRKPPSAPLARAHAPLTGMRTGRL